MRFLVSSNWPLGDVVIPNGAIVDITNNVASDDASRRVLAHFSGLAFQPAQLCEPKRITFSMPPNAVPLDEESRAWLKANQGVDRPIGEDRRNAFHLDGSRILR